MNVSLLARTRAVSAFLALASVLSPLASAAQPQIVVAGYGATEGNSGTKVFLMEVNLTEASASPVTFNIATSNGTATAGSDYVAKSLNGQSIPAGQTHYEFNVTVNGDTVFEPAETFYVTLSQVSGASVMVGQSYGQIDNDDAAPPNLPTISVADVSITEGNSGNKNATFTATLSAPAPALVTFDVSTPGGNTASPGIDYVDTNYDNLQIPAGQTSKTFVVPIIGDTNLEANELFFVFLADERGAVVGDDQALGTILNDDSAPLPTLSINDVTITEGNSLTKTASFTVSLSAPQASAVSVDVATSNFTAIAGSDYVAKSTLGLRIPAGSTSKAFNVTINGDTVAETDEIFSVSLSNAVGATIADNAALGTIINDDAATPPSLTIDDVTDVEDQGAKWFLFTVSLSAPATSDISFDAITSDGTATVAGNDYATQEWTHVVMPAGALSQTMLVQVNGDLVEEADENFFLTVSNVVNATVADGQGVGTIVNDDFGDPPTLSISDAHIQEGDDGEQEMLFTVTLSEVATKNVIFQWGTSNGTAIGNYDYEGRFGGAVISPGLSSTTLSVPVDGDVLKEADEYFYVTISNADTAVIDDAVAQGWIHDNGDTDPLPKLTVYSWESTTEGDSWPTTALFTVALAQPAATDVTFDFATSDGTAIAPDDYVAMALQGQTIPAGETSMMFFVEINGDTLLESDETFNANVSNVVGATVVDGSEVFTIINDDTAMPSLSVADVSISEGNSGTKTATFTVQLSAAASSAVSFNIASANGTATAGSDYVAISLNGQSIAAGQTSKTFSVTINGDTAVEPNETFTVNVSNVSGATVSDGNAVGTITNDDSAGGGATLSIADVSIAEGNASTKLATFTVSLSAAQSGPVLFDVATANGTATAGSDYVAKTTAGVRIAAGSTSKTFTVTINGDTVNEPDENFTVNLSNASGATIADAQAIGTITNDDNGGGTGPTLSIGDVTVAEGNSLNKQFTFTVSLSAAASTAVTYNIATANGTAVAPGDYAAKTLTGQSIAAGQTSKTFVVSVKGDTVVEPNETFAVNVTNVVGATVADGSATGTITNDDAAALSVARFDARGLVDDVDDGNHGPQVSTNEYTLLLADTAGKVCARTNAATVVGVDGIENVSVLRDLADATNAICAKSRYQAVMGEGTELGFLVEATADTDARGVQVLGQPKFEATSKLSSLQVQGSGHAGSITLLLPQPLPANAAARSTQLRTLGQAVQAKLKAEPQARLVLIGGVTVPGLLDLTARSLPAKSTLTGERVLVSPALLEEFGNSTIAFPALPANEIPAQVLQLQ